MIVDFFDAAGTWLDCCDPAQFDVQRLAAILTAKFGPVRMTQRDQVRYVKGASLDFGAWLLSV